MKIWDFHTEPPGPAISTRLKDRRSLGLPGVPAGRGPYWGLLEDGSRKGLGEGLMPEDKDRRAHGDTLPSFTFVAQSDHLSL